jgi:hypothetical protein
MKANRIFWGLIIVLLGVLLLLQTMGLLAWSAWSYFWPIFLILLGGWFILGPHLFKANLAPHSLSIPVETTQSAAVELKHGAGRLSVDGSAASGLLLEGDFVGEVTPRIQRNGDRTNVILQPSDNAGPWNFGGNFDGFNWNVRLNSEIPTDLTLRTGAGESKIDLRNLRLSGLTLETGMSATEIILPEKAAHTRVEIHSGMASVKLFVPQAVAARIRMQNGLMGEKIDQNRFPFNGQTYETPGYANAEHQVDIEVAAGVGSIDILSI